MDVRTYIVTRNCIAVFEKKIGPCRLFLFYRVFIFLNFVLRVNTYCFEADMRYLKCIVVVSDDVANQLLQSGDVCLYSVFVLY